MSSNTRTQIVAFLRDYAKTVRPKGDPFAIIMYLARTIENGED